MSAIQVSFIIIEFNCPELIRSCVEAIKKQCLDLVHEIIVSSNSEYDELKKIKIIQEIPEVQWFFNEKNGGFAYAMNRGLEMSSGVAAVLLNPDAKLMNPILPVFKYLMNRKEIAILGPKIVDKHGNIQDSCRKFMTPLDLFSRVIQRFFIRKDVLLTTRFDYNRMQPVDWVIGACMILKKAALTEIGLLDEKYFFYVEDMDLCYRMWSANWQVGYFPEWKVEYKGSRKSTVFFIRENLFNRMSLIHLRSYFHFMFKYKYVFYGRPGH